MRFNGSELAQVCAGTPVFEGRLNYRPPSGNFGQSGYKERWFRLRCNLLFYFRIYDTGKVDSEPSGVFVLENSSIQLEQSASIPFAFSIIFKDEPYKKHIFSGRSDSNVQDWINALKHCTYEYLRSQRILLQKQITLKTGKDPLLMYPYNEGVIRDFEFLSPVKAEGSPRPLRAATLVPTSHQRNRSPQGTSFQSHLMPVAPPRSSSPKSAIQPPPQIIASSTPTPLEPVKAQMPVSCAPREPMTVVPCIPTPPMKPVRAAPPVSMSPKSTTGVPPHMPSSEVNLIDL